MRTLFVLVVGIAVGAMGFYFYQQQSTRDAVSTPGAQASASARDAANSAVAKTRAAAAEFSEALNQKVQQWHLTPADIKADLAKSGQVARENTDRLRERTSDARIMAVIKAKYVLERDLSATSISVESADGNVTLTGTVSAENLVGQAVALALDTDGVHRVTSKLKVASP